MADLVKTPNGTFVTRDEAERMGLDVPKKKESKAAAASKPPTTRKDK